MRKPAEFESHPVALSESLWYRAVVRYVVDGDTLGVLVDYGFNQYGYHTIRLRNVDAPEVVGVTRAAGLAARDFLRDAAPPGTPVSIRTYKDAQTFGRYVADVFLEFPDGKRRSLADLLRDFGHGV